MNALPYRKAPVGRLTSTRGRPSLLTVLSHSMRARTCCSSSVVNATRSRSVLIHSSSDDGSGEGVTRRPV